MMMNSSWRGSSLDLVENKEQYSFLSMEKALTSVTMEMDQNEEEEDTKVMEMEPLNSKSGKNGRQQHQRRCNDNTIYWTSFFKIVGVILLLVLLHMTSSTLEKEENLFGPHGIWFQDKNNNNNSQFDNSTNMVGQTGSWFDKEELQEETQVHLQEKGNEGGRN